MPALVPFLEAPSVWVSPLSRSAPRRALRERSVGRAGRPRKLYDRKRLPRRSSTEDALSASQRQLYCETFPELLDVLAAELRRHVQTTDQRWMVGLAGMPGSGKTTVAHHLTQKLNSEASHDLPPVAAVVPMDGFHFYRHELDAMEDPVEARARRGAHWTFNAEAFLRALHRLRLNNEPFVDLPSFDHGVGDPVESDIQIDQATQILIIEGNYLLLDMDPWNQIPALLDTIWYAQCDLDLAMKRVYERHIDTGKPRDVAETRIRCNDGLNAQLVRSSAKRADFVFNSDF